MECFISGVVCSDQFQLSNRLHSPGPFVRERKVNYVLLPRIKCFVQRIVERNFEHRTQFVGWSENIRTYEELDTSG